MNTTQLDRGRFPPTLWRAMRGAGLDPAKVLRLAGLPATLHHEPSAIFSTAQLFAIWKAVETLTDDPVVALRLIRECDRSGHQPSFIAALYAPDFRDAIERIRRFKRLGSCETFASKEHDGMWTIVKEWPFATEAEPAVSIDITFGFLLEIGRRGTGRRLAPARIEYMRAGTTGDALEAYFGCRIGYGAKRNALTFHTADLNLPFPGHSPEFLDLVTPGLAAAFAEVEAAGSTSEYVKASLKRALASGRPEVGTIARDLGMSERTLQRRITDEGATFRALLADARRELGLQLLADPDMHVGEVTFLLGYQDTTSFYRAFREWEGVSPGEWRATHDKLATSERQALH